MKPVVVAKILQEALHGILAPPTGFITRWTSKNQILILNEASWSKMVHPRKVSGKCKYWSMNAMGLLQSKRRSKGITLTLQRTCCVPTSMNVRKMKFILYIYTLFYNIYTRQQLLQMILFSLDRQCSYTDERHSFAWIYTFMTSRINEIVEWPT